MAPPSPPPPPEFMDDITASLAPELLSEILLRLPPDEPGHLFRAALVCKEWLRAICDPGFLRRYRAFHGSPPLLGLLHRRQVVQGDPARHLARTTAAPLFPDPTFRRALDCHHGRTLLHASDDGWYLIVWDPVTGERHHMPEPDIPWLIYSAAVFCAVSGCDHLDCHGGPFGVVFMATDDDDELVKASVYLSETGAWSKSVILDYGYQSWQERLQAINRGELFHTPYVQPRRGALVGDEIYFTLRNENVIVKYNWGMNCLSKIDPPLRDVYDISLMEMENSSLGYACIQGSSLYVWSRKVNSEGAAEWVQCWVIELEQMVPVANHSDETFVVGSAEGVGVIFVSTDVGLFTIELKSRRVKKVAEPGVYFSVLPYMSFYTPGIEWLRAICDPGFLRRYRAFHGSPPLLGLLHRRQVVQGDPARHLARTTAAPLFPDPTFRRALDCHHGRTLLHASDDGWYLIVWDPVTGERHHMPEPDIPWLIYSAAVFCAVSGCDHLDCHGGPFGVVFMATDDDDELVKASVYLSETGAWSKSVILDYGYQSWQERLQAINRGELFHTPYVQPRRGALVGDEIYFTLRNENVIVKYNWGMNCLSKIDPPLRDVYDISLMEMENSSLGYACIQGSSLYVWSRKVNSEGAAEWVQCWVIELEQMVPVANHSDETFVVGSAEGVGVIFVSTDVGLFTIELKSRRVKKVAEPGVYFSVLPYMSFYTPEFCKSC
uniref:Uncharacterized protein n=1 Tax=Oryza punctata TaxID=4537 RepID=A0A0E0LTH6_ORYPU